MFDHLDMPSQQANPDFLAMFGLLAMSDLPVMPCLLAVSDLLPNSYAQLANCITCSRMDSTQHMLQRRGLCLAEYAASLPPSGSW